MRKKRRKVDERRAEYVRALEELMELAISARHGIAESLRDENVCVPIRVTFDLGLKSYAAFDKWRLYKRTRNKAKRQRRRRGRQLMLI